MKNALSINTVVAFDVIGPTERATPQMQPGSAPIAMKDTAVLTVNCVLFPLSALPHIGMQPWKPNFMSPTAGMSASLSSTFPRIVPDMSGWMQYPSIFSSPNRLFRYKFHRPKVLCKYRSIIYTSPHREIRKVVACSDRSTEW